VVHSSYSSQLGFKMRDSFLIGIAPIEKSEGALQETENLRLMMLRHGANLNQLHIVRRRPRPQMIGANPGKRIHNRDFAQGVQVRFAADRDRQLRLEKQIKAAGK